MVRSICTVVRIIPRYFENTMLSLVKIPDIAVSTVECLCSVILPHEVSRKWFMYLPAIHSVELKGTVLF